MRRTWDGRICVRIYILSGVSEVLYMHWILSTISDLGMESGDMIFTDPGSLDFIVEKVTDENRIHYTNFILAKETGKSGRYSTSVLSLIHI